VSKKTWKTDDERRLVAARERLLSSLHTLSSSIGAHTCVYSYHIIIECISSITMNHATAQQWTCCSPSNNIAKESGQRLSYPEAWETSTFVAMSDIACDGIENTVLDGLI